MSVSVSGPRTDLDGLGELEPLWRELHLHHREVSDYGPLVDDLSASWSDRVAWYRRLLAEGGAYLTATDADGRIAGYAMVSWSAGSDDTFKVSGGIAEVVTLIVRSDSRAAGIGGALLDAAESLARTRGFDTVKIAVMTGNDRAQRFYESRGYAPGELVLYRRLD